MSDIKQRIKHLIKYGGFWTIPNERTFLYHVLSDFASTQKGKLVLDVGAGVFLLFAVQFQEWRG